MKTFENSKIPRVFELMQEKGVKGAQITRDLGVSSGNISDWKSGKASPSSAVLVALANYLDTTVEYLTGESDEKKKPPVETEGEYDEDEDFKAFSKVLGDLTPEELQKVLSYAEFVLKQRNP